LSSYGFTPELKRLLKEAGCYFVRQGKGDHEVWYSPLSTEILRLITIYPIPARHLANVVLSAAGLKHADLARAHLTLANLRNAFLEGANLTRANLEQADLTGARLDGANLVDAKSLDQGQIDSALGDATTKLPAELTMPRLWKKHPVDIPSGRRGFFRRKTDH
jgi:hypothetical protein